MRSVLDPGRSLTRIGVVLFSLQVRTEEPNRKYTFGGSSLWTDASLLTGDESPNLAADERFLFKMQTDVRSLRSEYCCSDRNPKDT